MLMTKVENYFDDAPQMLKSNCRAIPIIMSIFHSQYFQ